MARPQRPVSAALVAVVALAGLPAAGQWLQPRLDGRTKAAATTRPAPTSPSTTGPILAIDRPCEAHHLRHRLHGGPTDLANLALVCRAHHRAVHEGGWRLARQADGRLTATPPHRRPQRAPTAA